MLSKNDLSALKIQHKNTLQNIQKENLTNKPKSWPKPKPIEAIQSKIIGLRFTEQQYEQIKQKAGLIAHATYLKNALFTQTDIFKSPTKIK